jgi:hypothetical protein
MSTEERRAPGSTRVAFEGIVEVGGALGPTFEAQAVNVSEDGIQLKTAYLPEPGQPLTCRFDAGASQSVLASGEVVWARGAERGGEFGLRFTDLDAESVAALKVVCGVGSGPPAVQMGSKVRLHIEGLASPMRAKIRDTLPAAVTVGSELGFLQVGRQLDLEDARSGNKRPAVIDRVDVTIDPSSQVPQLVVTLRYADVADGRATAAETSEPAGRASADRPTVGSAPAPADLEGPEQASESMKRALARGVERIGPALSGFAERAKTMVGILAKRRRERTAELSQARRTTAPPPGGGLRATGRRVVRADSSPGLDEAGGESLRIPIGKRRTAIAAGIMAVAIVGGLVIKKMHHEPTPVAATQAPAAAAAAPAPVAPTPPAAPSNPPAAPAQLEPAPAAPPSLPPPAGGDADEAAELARNSHKAHARVPSFTNGPVHHANVLHLKMDGAIESIEGAQQPAGFAVKLPGRKSLEPAAPLQARDSRIAAIKVSNDAAGAELTVAFKDGVPNYRVSARGDTLVIALAPAGALEPTLAKKDDHDPKGARAGKRAAPLYRP